MERNIEANLNYYTYLIFNHEKCFLEIFEAKQYEQPSS